MPKKSAKTKKPATKKREKKEEPVIEEEAGLRAKQELFCRYFVEDRECFDNATLSYAAAYGFELDTLSREKKLVAIPGKKKKTRENESEYKRAYNVCSVAGRNLLRNHKIKERCRDLLLDMLDDKVQDSELSWLVQQRKKLDVKLGAIKAVQALKKRIKEETNEPIKVDITVQLTKVYGGSPQPVS